MVAASSFGAVSVTTPDHSPAIDLVPITEVERITGIRQATLRMWERRYGFPQPLRDRHGERIYPPEQVARLQAAQRLIAAGARPGRIFAGGASPPPPPEAAPSARQQLLIGMLRDYRVTELHTQFQFRLMELGLRRFVTDCLDPLSLAVAASWRAGDLPLRCMRLYGQVASAFLQARLATVRNARDGRPRAVLAAIAGEAAVPVGVMAEAILTTHEVKCIQLGADLPAHEIAAAAVESGAAIVVVSLGAGAARRELLRVLIGLRSALPFETVLWIVGDGMRPAGLPDGVQAFASMAAFEEACAARRLPS